MDSEPHSQTQDLTQDAHRHAATGDDDDGTLFQIPILPRHMDESSWQLKQQLGQNDVLIADTQSSVNRSSSEREVVRAQLQAIAADLKRIRMAASAVVTSSFMGEFANLGPTPLRVLSLETVSEACDCCLSPVLKLPY